VVLWRESLKERRKYNDAETLVAPTHWLCADLTREPVACLWVRLHNPPRFSLPPHPGAYLLRRESVALDVVIVDYSHLVAIKDDGRINGAAPGGLLPLRLS
jgi:hypothetical protein